MSTTTTLDKAGRLVLPKPIRDRLRLLPGARLRVELSGDIVEITPEAEEPRIEIRNGLPVIVGGGPFDAVAAVREAREASDERFRKRFSR